MTSTGDVDRWWKEQFKSLLNPSNTSSVEEAEPVDSEVDSPITGAEVAEALKKVDEIHPEFLKSLDVVGLSLLIRVCNMVWTLGAVLLDWQTRMVVPLFKKGD